MPIIYLTVKTVRAVRIFRTPAFGLLSRQTQTGIARNLGIEAAKGAALRSGAWFVVGLIIDPYNRVAVPASGGGLTSSKEAASRVLALDLQGEVGEVGIAIVADTLGFGWHFTRGLLAKAGEQIPVLNSAMVIVAEVAGGLKENFTRPVNRDFGVTP